MERLVPGVFALMLAVTAPSFGAAADAGDAEAMLIKVTYADLDLGRPTDASRLLRRIRTAALEACGASGFSAAGYKASVMQSDCYATSVARAVGMVGAPKVFQLYRQQVAAHDPGL